MSIVRKILFFIMLSFCAAQFSYAQKIGYVNIDEILKKIPQYKKSQQELNSLASKWKQELDEEKRRIEIVEKDFHLEKVFLTDDQIDSRKAEIERRYVRYYNLQKNRFGPGGQMEKIRIQLVKPLQDFVYAAVEAVAKKENLGLIIEKKSGLNIIYAHRRYNKTEAVLIELGYNPQTGLFRNIKLKNLLKQAGKDQLNILKEDAKKSLKESVDEIGNSLKDAKPSKKNTKGREKPIGGGAQTPPKKR